MPESIRAERQLPSPSVLIVIPLWKNQMNQGLVKDNHFLPLIRKWTFLKVMSEALVITMKDLYKSFLLFFLQLPKAKYSGHTMCPCFQGLPNYRAIPAQEILKLVKSDLCKCFASNTTSYIWMCQFKKIYNFPMQHILLLFQNKYLYGGSS